MSLGVINKCRLFFFMYKLFMLQIINKQFNTFSSLLHMIWLYKPFTLILVSKSQRTAHLSHVNNMFLSILFYKSNKKKIGIVLMNELIHSFFSLPSIWRHRSFITQSDDVTICQFAHSRIQSKQHSSLISSGWYCIPSFFRGYLIF